MNGETFEGEKNSGSPRLASEQVARNAGERRREGGRTRLSGRLSGEAYEARRQPEKLGDEGGEARRKSPRVRFKTAARVCVCVELPTEEKNETPGGANRRSRQRTKREVEGGRAGRENAAKKSALSGAFEKPRVFARPTPQKRKAESASGSSCLFPRKRETANDHGETQRRLPASSAESKKTANGHVETRKENSSSLSLRGETNCRFFFRRCTLKTLLPRLLLFPQLFSVSLRSENATVPGEDARGKSRASAKGRKARNA
ncbi:hypothetical protein TGPRC2_235430 [Toxoplasma gondii TgCatPRC2]|uniref:Uncharacterized protein n=4 Tax=Toxoplasma gondii TaxID=5811 RepID=A0A151H4M7_TOXGO|nr:hypothetical protein TGME49_235430 [Toxoplasma gondii ME49]EPT26738.1 hypothetical protein TGME49_235430 [Toxoplasma gondii ME49]KFG31496.1 hypothetical protein TGDOM2_235430 [Toxoplasma gondii GAB2-2007-GAL-DOM2]KYF38729.1 hypothetical protein TGARI_235430 [Toxoplasma gondii ARI]KYK64296.1 hypothetical protein TGPRC2_235430 [Toxoplasma gondii TgCatPRC2]|eukprot:XP_002368938.1 hypothetical protein TGME49_235430 [Toxoplasma gondii ME49]